MKSHSIKIFIGLYVIILAINFFWFIGRSPLELEAPFRILFGSLLIFLLPGLVWGEVLGFRSNHFLETIALSFALTLAIEIILLPVPFIFHSTIRLWVWLLFGVSLLGMAIFIFKSKNTEKAEFLDPIFNFLKQPSPLNISIPLIAVILMILSYGAYRWGEHITDIDGEKLLHLTFVRYYYSMPMVLQDLSIYRGAPPLNLIHLWEYLIAGWASLLNIDPLLLLYRARFVMPLLGFSGMYLLIRNIFSNKIKSEIILWGVLLMCMGWLALLSPSNLDWVRADPFRGIMSFMGTAHRADSAMEILIPLNAGLVLLAFRNPNWRSFLLLAGILIASFMWHVREFFQTAVYFGIFGITLLLIPNIDRKILIKRWSFVMAIFLAVIIFFAAAMLLIVPKQSHSYDELKLKEIALSYALQDIIGVRNLFNFPVDLRLTQGLDKNTLVTHQQLASLFKNSWNYFLWLFLSALAIPFLTMKGDKEDKHLSIFYILLWFLILSWNFSMMLLIVLTYSEILFTTPRMIYLFSYIIIASAFYLIFQLLDKKMTNLRGLILYFVLICITGFLIKFWWSNGLPLARTISTILSILFIISFFLLLFPKMPKVNSLKTSGFFTTIIGILVFFIPILAKDYTTVISKIFKQGRPSIEWFNDSNPFGFSKDLIHFIRSTPPEQTFLMDPFGKACISVYSPQYMAMIPEMIGITVLNARDVYADLRQGKHPLFKTLSPTEQINPDLITKAPDFQTHFLNWKGPDSIKNNIAKAVSPMVLHNYKGDFIFTRIPDRGGNIIRVSPSLDRKVEQHNIQFGYALKDQGFDLKMKGGQEVVFVVTARLSNNTKKPAQLLIVDVTNTLEVSNVLINETSWKHYVVRKTIRDNVSTVTFGIAWQPEKENEWIEIKNVRIYVLDSLLKNYLMPPFQIDHQAVKEWLNRYAVDYILIEKNYYINLLPYFHRFPEDYNIVFNNKENGEFIARYLRR